MENAVRHGITKREGGGTVEISAQETDSDIIITVIDGGGFEQNTEKHDGSVHIGIENVKSRLQSMCGGNLEIKNRIGLGTTAVITLPKQAVLNKGDYS